jgi:hypothetical protein
VVLPALAAELVISALNQSMDSFDQAPSATMIELKMAEFLCRLAGLPKDAGATLPAAARSPTTWGCCWPATPTRGAISGTIPAAAACTPIFTG